MLECRWTQPYNPAQGDNEPYQTYLRTHDNNNDNHTYVDQQSVNDAVIISFVRLVMEINELRRFLFKFIYVL